MQGSNHAVYEDGTQHAIFGGNLLWQVTKQHLNNKVNSEKRRKKWDGELSHLPVFGDVIFLSSACSSEHKTRNTLFEDMRETLLLKRPRRRVGLLGPGLRTYPRWNLCTLYILACKITWIYWSGVVFRRVASFELIWFRFGSVFNATVINLISFALACLMASR